MMNLIKDEQKTFLDKHIENEKKRIAEVEDFLKNTNGSLESEIEAIQKCWENKVRQHKKPLRLVILAEAPLSFERYFYNKMGGFLSGLKSPIGLNKNEDLRELMKDKGILLLDIYKLPIPSEFYKADKKNCLFDPEYFRSKLESIKELIGDNTMFVFRYKALIKKFQDNDDFKGIMNKYKLLIDSSNIVSLYELERPQRINPVVKPYL